MKRLTAAIIKQRLMGDNRTISLVSYGGTTVSNTSVWKCHDCDHEWNANAGNVLAGKGCPSCAHRVRLTPTAIQERLNSRPITLLKYGNSARDMSSVWKCQDCDHEWNTTASSILNSGTGCAKCHKRIHLGSKTVISASGYKRISYRSGE